MNFNFVRYALSAAAVVIGLTSLAAPAAAQYSNPMRDVDNPARQPWASNIVKFISQGQSGATEMLVTVPAGKRLVIETITIRSIGPMGYVADLTVSNTSGGSNASFYFAPSVKYRSLTDQGVVTENWQGTHPVRIYADPGTTVHLSLSIGSNTAPNYVQVNMGFSGYLVNLP